MPIPELSADSSWFPDPEEALTDPDGLLAWGGDLTSDRLRAAYREGIFPWFSAGQPLLWWSPDPRMVLIPNELHISRSMRRRLNSENYRVTLNHDFASVIRGCAAPRSYSKETWIVPAMQQAYINLHKAGIAHSIECWHGDQLVGGLYGIAMGSLFFGESMFSTQTDASKVVFILLARHLQSHQFQLLDCQLPNDHLQSLGASTMPRSEFLDILRKHRDDRTPPTALKRQELQWSSLRNLQAD